MEPLAFKFFTQYCRNCVLLLSVFVLFSCGFLEGENSNISKSGSIHVPHNASYQSVLDSLSSYLKNIDSFDAYAQLKNYPNNIKSGKYKFEQGETNKEILRKLQLGLKEEVNVRVKNNPTVYHMAGQVSKKIEADSAEIIESIINLSKKEGNGNAEQIKYWFLPNTYRFYWDTTGEDFLKRMQKEHNKFWNQERLALAKKMGFTAKEVTILASIVQLEAPKADEQAKVARAYLNRLKMGKKLQADPTSVYAYQLQNGFGQNVPRVYHKHTQTESEYNTYKTHGLPPAPICLPNSTAIDAVLQPANHNYIYLCADPKRPGYHKFTNDYAQHERNATKYRNWLNKNGIR